MKQVMLVMAVVVGALSPLVAQAQDPRETGTYAEMRTYLGELFEQKKYAEMAAMLERVLDRFPDHVRANTYNLAAARVLMGQPDNAIAALEDGLRRGAFYSRWDFDGALMSPLKQHPRFSAFLRANLERIAEADKKASMKLEVATPPGYDPTRRYPLFVALHGGGEDIAMLKPNWVSPRLQAEFIVAYVQSSQVVSMTGFHWQDENRTRRDLQAAYGEVVANYPVDPDRVIVGGFSSGGFASLVTAFHQTLPARGFVALCPEVPATLTDADITAAVKRGLRGALLTTELDHRVEAQRALAERWKKLGLDGEFAVTPNIGHWFPKDFGQQLDRAIERILAPLPPRAPGWTRMASGTTNNLTGLWGTSLSDIFAVGPKGTILHFDGRTWSRMAVTGEPHLLSIWGSSSHDVFVVGDDGVILHYDGNAWTSMASGTTKNLISVWGASSRDVFAAGYGGTVLHYDGAGWTPMATGTTGDLYCIWGTASNSVVAVGGTPMPLPGKGLVLRYDGKAWSPMAIPDSPFLGGVWGSSTSDVFAVGVNLAILHFDGKAWTAMPANAPIAPGKPNLLIRAWGTGPGDVYAAGFDGVLLHYDGRSWSSMPSGTTESMGVFGVGREVFIGGGGGTILRYAPPPQPQDLVDAAGRGDLDRVKDILAREPALATGDYTTAEGFSAVSLALHNRREVVVGYLLGRRAPLVLSPAGTYRRLIAAEVAASMADPKVLEIFQGQGLESSFRNQAGMTLAHFAARAGAEEVLRKLIACGAPLDQADVFGRTPLHMAARAGHASIVRLLLERQVNANARTIDGRTPYWVALEEKQQAAADILAAHGADKSGPRPPTLSGPYLGQKPPGRTPVPFVPALPGIDEGRHGIFSFTPDGAAVYWKPSWSALTAIFRARLDGGTWAAAEVAPFSAANQADDAPFVTPDGSRLFFVSARPLVLLGPNMTAQTAPPIEKIWMVTRTDTGWSEPQKLPEEVNKIAGIHWQFSADSQNNLYFGARGGIHRARFTNGRYLDAERLAPPINDGKSASLSPFIAPDGSYLIFSRYHPIYQYQLFVSFRRPDGSWKEPINLGDVLQHPYSLNGRVSPDGKYLFFTGRSGVDYWVDAGILDDLRAR